MKKLINLLNEYEKNRIEKINSEGKLMVKLSFKPYTEESLTNKAYRSCWLEICSKYYGFIQWLVDNDKIDFDKCGLDIKDYLSYSKRYDKGIVMAENYDNDTFVVREFYSPYEQLLMLLSIQDNPISFLIGILR